MNSSPSRSEPFCLSVFLNAIRTSLLGDGIDLLDDASDEDLDVLRRLLNEDPGSGAGNVLPALRLEGRTNPGRVAPPLVA